MPPGDCVPGDRDLLPASQSADIRLIHEGAHLHFRQVRDLHQQVSRIDELALPHRQGIDHSSERGADIRILQQLASGVVGCLCLGVLRHYALHLGARIARLELLVSQIQFRLRRAQLILSGFNLGWGSGAGGLQTLQSFQIALRVLDLTACLHQLRFSREHFLMRATAFHCRKICF